MALRKKVNCLREERNQRGLSGFDLQILSTIPASSIYLIERGLKRPQAYEKRRLSEALNISEDELFPEDMARNPTIEGLTGGLATLQARTT